MNPEYIVLAGWFWRCTGKRLGLWYNHTVGSIALHIAAPFVHTLCHTSPYAATARLPRAKRMPAGIDTALFSPQDVVRTPRSIYFQGRVAPAKRVHILCEAFRLLRALGTEATLSVVGPEERAYAEKLRADYVDLVKDGTLAFLGPRRHRETPALYAAHTVAVNLTAGGNFDKTALEAMASGTPVIVGSTAFGDLVPGEWVIEGDDPEALMSALARMFSLTKGEYATLAARGREGVSLRHSLPALAAELERAYENT